MLYKLKEEQRYGRNKDTVVNYAYINSGEYRRKFDRISDNEKLNKLLYRLAKTMLKHRSGTLYEDMYWIDAETATVVAKETACRVEKEVTYSGSTLSKIEKKHGLVTIHTHPSGSPPSHADFLSNYVHRYSLGIVCGHNKKVYVYTANEAFSGERYNSVLGKILNRYKDEEIVISLFFEELQKRFHVMVKEVK